MIISSFTEPELDIYRDQCNFTGTEREVFELRSEGIPLEYIAELMHLSVDGVKKISRKVNKKIAKIHFVDTYRTL